MRSPWPKRILLVLLIVLLMAALIFPASGASTVYQMAVNDKMVPMTAENMPLMVNNTLHIPYIMLYPQTAGINLGVRAQYNSSRGTLTVTNDLKAVTFDTRRNTAYDESGNAVNARVTVRNTMAYLPVDWLCSYFSELQYSLTVTAYGTLVRLTNSAVILDDVQFVDAASDMMQDNLIRYQNSLVTSTPSPSVTAPPSPTVTTTPSPSVEPTPAPLVYLAFRWGDHAARIAETLEEHDQRALFFFTSGELVRQDDLVRRLTGQGHQIGLILTGVDSASCLEQLTAGRQLLSDIARCPLVIVTADDLDNEKKAALEEAGCVIWMSTVQANGLTQSGLLRQLSPTKPNYVELTCDEHGFSLISDALRALTGKDYRLRQALAPLL